MNKFNINDHFKSIPIVGNKIYLTKDINSINYLTLENIYFILDKPLKNPKQAISIKNFNLSYDSISFKEIPNLEIDFAKLPCKLFNAASSTRMIPVCSKNFSNLLTQINNCIEELSPNLDNNILNKYDYFNKLTSLAKDINAAINIIFFDDASEECLTEDLAENIYDIFNFLIDILNSLTNSILNYRELLTQHSLELKSAADLLASLFNIVEDTLSLNNFIENETGFNFPDEATNYLATVKDAGQVIKDKIIQLYRLLFKDCNKSPFCHCQHKLSPSNMIAVTGISFNLSRFATVPGEIKSLKAQIIPSNATNQNIRYFSSNENVATVDQNGVITTKNNGTAVITAVTIDGGYTTTCTITVNDQLLQFAAGSVSNYDASSTEDIFVIPDKIAGQEVSAIAPQTFVNATNLTTIIIPNSVISIGEGAFAYCTSLTSITLPDSITAIAKDTFLGCSSLTSIILPNSIVSIGPDTFALCTSLISITLPNSLTAIADNTFASCTSLTSIIIPNTVTSIGSNAFNSSTSLTSIDIPDSVTSIGNGAFALCSSLSSVTLPANITSISDNTFRSCSALSSIIIPDFVSTIGSSAFEGCSALDYIYLGDSVSTIGNRAFINIMPGAIFCVQGEIAKNSLLSSGSLINASQIKRRDLNECSISLVNFNDDILDKIGDIIYDITTLLLKNISKLITSILRCYLAKESYSKLAINNKLNTINNLKLNNIINRIDNSMLKFLLFNKNNVNAWLVSMTNIFDEMKGISDILSYKMDYNKQIDLYSSLSILYPLKDIDFCNTKTKHHLSEIMPEQFIENLQIKINGSAGKEDFSAYSIINLNKDSAIPISKFGNINNKFAANISLKDFNSIDSIVQEINPSLSIISIDNISKINCYDDLQMFSADLTLKLSQKNTFSLNSQQFIDVIAKK